ncbi:MAG: hypothetical protein EXS08_10700 [Planctomycetes bacterium]|nr:hypothetical protein [Planctomycetota bacterium]
MERSDSRVETHESAAASAEDERCYDAYLARLLAGEDLAPQEFLRGRAGASPALLPLLERLWRRQRSGASAGAELLLERLGEFRVLRRLELRVANAPGRLADDLPREVADLLLSQLGHAQFLTARSSSCSSASPADTPRSRS